MIPPLFVNGHYYLLSADFADGWWTVTALDLVHDTTLTARHPYLDGALNLIFIRLAKCRRQRITKLEYIPEAS